MKIVATIHDAGMAINVGGSVLSESAIIEIKDSDVPLIVEAYLRNRKVARDSDGHTYQTLSFSLLDE
jgi:hypothetical protein